MKGKIINIFIGVFVGILLTGAVAVAGNGATKIEVYFKNIKYMFDGVQKSPIGGQGIIYEGTTYVPLRFVADSFGKDVSWDGKTETIWIGKKEGSFKYLSDLNYARLDGKAKDSLYFDEWTNPRGLKFTVAGNEYLHGMGIILDAYSYYGADERGSIDYNLNGQYQRISGFVGIDDYTKNSDNSGSVILYGDGEEIYRIKDLKGGDNPISIDVNIKGVLKLSIHFESRDDKGEQININLVDVKIY